jgi:hypothetical protein
LFMELVGEYVPPEGYEYSLPGEDGMLIAEDFDGRVDVVPVSDPNIISATQRIAQAQAVLDLSNQAPDMYDTRSVHLNMLQAMRVQNPEMFIPPEQEPPRQDPVTENTSLLTGQPVKVFEDQDHSSHLTVHGILMQRIPQLDSLGAKGSSKRAEIENNVLSHMAEHLAAQVRIDFGNALMQMGIQLPNEELPPEMENQVAMAAAAAAQSLTPEPGPDPAAIEAAAKAAMQEEAARADMRRKDAMSAAELERKNALTAAEISRKAAQQEADLLRNFISENAKMQLAANPPVPEKPMA